MRLHGNARLTPHGRDLMCQRVRLEGWTVAEAPNGRIGLERVAQDRPDLIVLDLMMPEMDGFEFVRELRKVPAWRTIPVVVITAKELTDEDRLRLKGYVQKVLEKGACSREELLGEVRDLVASRIPARGTP